ncbi:MAG: hypothetical protein M1161_02310 [Candidatus Thermoplasmatota archaeon]|jgi:hypothetical protein|nr:hypothetical protein [Candidatus Thermoplasmatota archaeon]
MSKSVFELKAQVSSDNPSSVLEIVRSFIGRKGEAVLNGELIEVRAELEGESAKDLNRMLLSEMRRVEKKTRLRAEWTSNNITERFFDYVSKGVRKPK